MGGGGGQWWWFLFKEKASGLFLCQMTEMYQVAFLMNYAFILGNKVHVGLDRGAGPFVSWVPLSSSAFAFRRLLRI